MWEIKVFEFDNGKILKGIEVAVEGCVEGCEIAGSENCMYCLRIVILSDVM